MVYFAVVLSLTLRGQLLIISFRTVFSALQSGLGCSFCTVVKAVIMYCNLHLLQGDCYGIDGVLNAYMNVAQYVRMSGPTCFAPLIRRAIDIVKQSRDVSTYSFLIRYLQ